MTQTGESLSTQKETCLTEICQLKIQLRQTGRQTKATTGNLDLIVHAYLLYCFGDLAVL